MDTHFSKFISENNISDFEHFKQEIKQFSNIKFKEDSDNNIAIIYNNEFQNKNCKNLKYKNFIVNTKTLGVISTQYNELIYDESAKQAIASKNNIWKTITVSKSYEGTVIVVFNHNNKWFITTKKCIDSDKARFNGSITYSKLFNDAIKDKFEMEELDDKYCYHFILMHYNTKYKKQNISFPNNVVHILTTEKYTMKEVDFTINNNVLKNEYESINSLEELQNKLKSIDDLVYNEKKPCDGYILRLYKNDLHRGKFLSLKMQTKVSQISRETNNFFQYCLKLFNIGKFEEYSKYIRNPQNDLTSEEIHKMLKISMKMAAHELLIIYMKTRNNNGKQIHEELLGSQKKFIYQLHGIYLERINNNNKLLKESEFPVLSKESEPEKKQNNNPKITIDDVSNLMLKIEPKHLVSLFYERMQIMKKSSFVAKVILKNSPQTESLCEYMFNYEKEKGKINKEIESIDNRDNRDNRDNGDNSP